MIPYDDLVIALQTWRARQGLPVAQLSGVAISPPPIQAAAPDFGARPGPPAAPPRAAPTPPPLAPVDTRDDEVDEASLIEEEAQYENEGDDFAMAFGGQPPPETADESTSIGTAPPPGRDSFGGSTEPEPPPGKHNRNDDW
jgi:hypothetical protein